MHSGHDHVVAPLPKFIILYNTFAPSYMLVLDTAAAFFAKPGLERRDALWAAAPGAFVAVLLSCCYCCR